MFTLLAWIAGIVATAVLVTTWSEVISFACNFIKQVASHWNIYVEDILNGAWESIIQRLDSDFAVVAQRYYFRGNDGNYYKKTTCEKIDVNEIPPHLRSKVKTQKVTDATDDMRQELQNELS